MALSRRRESILAENNSRKTGWTKKIGSSRVAASNLLCSQSNSIRIRKPRESQYRSLMELLCFRIWGSERFPPQSGGNDSKFEALRLTKQKLEATYVYHSLAWSSSSCVSILGHVATEPLGTSCLFLGASSVPILGLVATEPLGTRGGSLFGGRYSTSPATSERSAQVCRLGGGCGRPRLSDSPSSSSLKRPGLAPSHANAGLRGAGLVAAAGGELGLVATSGKTAVLRRSLSA